VLFQQSKNVEHLQPTLQLDVETLTSNLAKKDVLLQPKELSEELLKELVLPSQEQLVNSEEEEQLAEEEHWEDAEELEEKLEELQKKLLKHVTVQLVQSKNVEHPQLTLQPDVEILTSDLAAANVELQKELSKNLSKELVHLLQEKHVKQEDTEENAEEEFSENVKEE